MSANTSAVKGVPAEICDNCGEEYVSSETNSSLLKTAKEAASKGVELEMMRFAA